MILQWNQCTRFCAALCFDSVMYISGSKFVRSCGISLCITLRNCQPLFHSSWTILDSHLQYRRVLISSHTCQNLLPVFDYSHPDVCKAVSHYGFDLNFPNECWCWASFKHWCAYWPFICLFGEMFISLLHFKIKLFAFYY